MTNLQHTDWIDMGMAATNAHGDYLRELEGALVEIPQTKHAIARLKRDLDEIEAEAILNGQAAGSNDQQRKAALAYSLKGNETYRALTQDLRETETKLLCYEAQASVAEHGMKGCRAALEWLASMASQLGAEIAVSRSPGPGRG